MATLASDEPQDEMMRGSLTTLSPRRRLPQRAPRAGPLELRHPCGRLGRSQRHAPSTDSQPAPARQALELQHRHVHRGLARGAGHESTTSSPTRTSTPEGIDLLSSVPSPHHGEPSRVCLMANDGGAPRLARRGRTPDVSGRQRLLLADQLPPHCCRRHRSAAHRGHPLMGRRARRTPSRLRRCLGWTLAIPALPPPWPARRRHEQRGFRPLRLVSANRREPRLPLRLGVRRRPGGRPYRGVQRLQRRHRRVRNGSHGLQTWHSEAMPSCLRPRKV